MDTKSPPISDRRGATKTPASLANRYVVVFAFTQDRKNILLVKKNKPDYLCGKWNGPGGRIEEHDKIVPHIRNIEVFEAARREVLEETNVDLYNVDIEHIIHMTFYPSWVHRKENAPLHIDFCAAFTDKICHYKQMEDELVGAYPVNYVMRSGMKLVSNLYWMIPYALNPHRTSLLHCEEVQQ